MTRTTLALLLCLGIAIAAIYTGYSNRMEMITFNEQWTKKYTALEDQFTSLTLSSQSVNQTLNYGLIKQPDMTVYKDKTTYLVVDKSGIVQGNYTDAGTAINAAIGTESVDVRRIFCRGTFQVETQIWLHSNLIFEFETLDFTGLNEPALLIADNSSLVRNLWIEGIELRNPSTGLANAQQNSTSLSKSYDIHVNIGLIRNARYQAVNLANLLGDVWIDYLRTDNVAITNTATWQVEIENIEGLTIGTLSVTKPTHYGIKISQINGLWITNLFVDTPGNDGILLFGIANAYLDRLIAHGCPGTGIVIMHPNSVNINLLAASLCGGDGIRIQSTDGYATQIMGIHVNHCGAILSDGCGVRLMDATDVCISLLQAVDTYPEFIPVMKHALVDDAQSDYNQVGMLNTINLLGTAIVSTATHSRYPQ